MHITTRTTPFSTTEQCNHLFSSFLCSRSSLQLMELQWMYQYSVITPTRMECRCVVLLGMHATSHNLQVRPSSAMLRRVVVGVPVLQRSVPADTNVQMVFQYCVNRPTTVRMRAALLKRFARSAPSVISPRCVLPSTARLVLMYRVQAKSHAIPVLLGGSAQTLQHPYCALRDILVLVGFRPQPDAKLDVSAISALQHRFHAHPVSTVCE